MRYRAQKMRDPRRLLGVGGVVVVLAMMGLSAWGLAEMMFWLALHPGALS